MCLIYRFGVFILFAGANNAKYIIGISNGRNRILMFVYISYTHIRIRMREYYNL